jgi:hypothetical protein
VTVLQIYERVSMVRTMEQREFFGHLNDTQDELISSYGQLYVLKLAAKPINKHPAQEDFPDIADPSEFYMAQDTGLIYVAPTAPYTSYVGVFQTITALNDEIMIDESYHTAIVDNILFLAGMGEIYKGEFFRKAEAAYRRVWSSRARYKTRKRYGW